MKRFLIGLLIIIVGIVAIVHRYQFFPAKKVTLNEQFTVHKWQTVSFGNDKYATYCGTYGNEVAGTGPFPEFRLKVKGVEYPCTHNAMQYFKGPTMPYSVVLMANGNPATVVIKDSNEYYHEWADGYIKNNCDTYNFSASSQKSDCLFKTDPSLLSIGDPDFCNRQTMIDGKECFSGYVKNFKNMCSVRESKEVSDGVWSREVTNQDDCLVEEITTRHLPSSNCSLLIEDTAKRNKCLEDRKTEEDKLNQLKY
jgi:hypothetical protein